MEKLVCLEAKTKVQEKYLIALKWTILGKQTKILVIDPIILQSISRIIISFNNKENQFNLKKA